MEKIVMSFIEKFAAAGKELGNEMVASNKDAMIMIATSEGIDDSCVFSRIQGKSSEIASLLAYVAIKNKDFKTILTDAIKGVEAWEQRNK